MAECVRELWKGRPDGIRFLDPAVGTGALYSALRMTLGPDLVERATGVELDERFAEAASKLWREDGLDVVKGDFTRLIPPSEGSRYNLILTNPPYVRHHHLGRSEKTRLKRL